MCEIKSGIYKITSPSNKVYIGQSIDIENRKNYYAINDCKPQIRLYNSLKKYGFENHLFETIEFCEVDKLNERERYWQENYDVLGLNGLNCKLTKTADKSGSHSEETKRKIGESNKGKIRTDAHKQKYSDAKKGKNLTELHKESIRESLVGKPKTEEHKKKMSERMIGSKLSEEAKRKISEAHKGRKLSEEHKRKIAEAKRKK